jgi:3-oxoacyl-[acyl-carrier-protein] synthase-3
VSSPAHLIGCGSHLPALVVDNTKLAGLLGAEEAWIFDRTGIRYRHWVSETETTSDLAAMAARSAMKAAQVDAEEIDWLIAGTMTPDHQIPGIAPILQAKLGLRSIPCLDIRMACCNSLYGFALAASLVASQQAARVLVVCAEAQSKGLRMTPEGRDISILFGDGAAACVIASNSSPNSLELIEVQLRTDGSFAKELAVLAPGTGNGSRWQSGLGSDDPLAYPIMDGKIVSFHSVRKMCEAARAILTKQGLAPSDLDLIVPHQANGNLLQAVAQQLGIPKSKVVSILEWSGNTSSASLLLALDHAYRQGSITPGGFILFLAFGAGFTWGAGLARAAG